MHTISCKQCGGTMVKANKKEISIPLQLLGIILCLIGIALCFTIIGILIGIPLMIIGALIGFKVKKVWKCQSCGYYFEHAN